MYSIVFVCTGNTCRSPMAEAIGRAHAGDLGEDVEFFSAGLMASDGVPASPHAQFVVGERGGDLSAHRSQSLSDELLARSDLVLTMTRGHRDLVRSRIGEDGPEVLSLAEIAEHGDAEVHDPHGGSLELYERTYEQIERLIRAALPELERRITAKSQN